MLHTYKLICTPQGFFCGACAEKHKILGHQPNAQLPVVGGNGVYDNTITDEEGSKDVLFCTMAGFEIKSPDRTAGACELLRQGFFPSSPVKPSESTGIANVPDI